MCFAHLEYMPPSPSAWPDASGYSQVNEITELETLQNKLQTGLMGYGALAVAAGLVCLMLGHAGLKLLVMAELETLDLGGPVAQYVRSALWFLIIVPVLLSLGAVWQARNTLQAIEQQVRWPGKVHAQNMRRQIKLARNWLQAAKIIPLVLTVLSVIGYVSASLMGEGETPLRLVAWVARNGVMQAINWLVLSAVQDWLSAVYRSTLGSKAPTAGYLERVSAWFTFLLLPLGLNLLGALAGIFISITMSSTFLRKMGIRLDMTPEQAGLFSQLSGGLLTLSVLLGVWSILSMLLLNWSRHWARRVSQRLDAQLAPQESYLAQPMGTARRLGA